jgi:hypothetical protein
MPCLIQEADIIARTYIGDGFGGRLLLIFFDNHTLSAHGIKKYLPIIPTKRTKYAETVYRKFNNITSFLKLSILKGNDWMSGLHR